MHTEKNKKYMLEYYFAHREEQLEYQRNYYQKNKEKIDARHSAYREEKREYYREYYRNYYQKHRDKILDQAKKYSKEHYTRPRHSRYADSYDVFKDGEFFRRFEKLSDLEKFFGYGKTTLCVYIAKNKNIFGYTIKRNLRGKENEN